MCVLIREKIFLKQIPSVGTRSFGSFISFYEVFFHNVCMPTFVSTLAISFEQ